MLLKNYYTALTASFIGGSGLISGEEDTANSPRYSKNILGNTVACQLLGNLYGATFTKNSPDDIYYGAIAPTGGGTSSYENPTCIWFGKNTTEPSFTDFAPQADYKVALGKTLTSSTLTYDANTKTYTRIYKYTLTNNSDYDLEINEILLGGSFGLTNGKSSEGACAFTRDILGENSFTILSKESVKFELTIKYTIAEPLQ